jgi:hypothetical protein
MHWITPILVFSLMAGTAQAADNVMTNGGTSDSWNTAVNWSLGVVPGTNNNAVVGTNIIADVNDAATPAYNGSLTLEAGATLRLQNNAADYNALGGATSNITLHAGSQIQINRAATINVTQPIVLAGDSQIYLGTSHHQTRHFDGAISGPGALTFVGNNNQTANLNTNNTLDGLIAGSGANWRIDANAAGSLGVGDVTINNAITLRINTSNTIEDTASLYLVGGRDTKLSGATYAKLHMGADETVNELYRDGYQVVAGAYTDASGSWISGGGTLTVSTSAVDVTPPTLLGSNFVDSVFGGPIYEDITQMMYTVSFSEDMDAATVGTNDFSNAGSAALRVDAVTETTEHPHPSVFTVDVTLLSTGTIQFQVFAGAVLNDVAGNPLDTTTAIADDTIIIRNAGGSPPTTISGTAGGTDSWSESANWDNGIPFGPTAAVINSNVVAQVSTTPQPYSGALTLNPGATLYMRSIAGRAALTFASAITLEDASTIIFADAGTYTISSPITLLGDVSYRADGSGGSHHDHPLFAGIISGSGSLSFGGVNNDTFTLAAANTFSGGLSSSPVATQGHRIKGTVNGAFGSGDVTINNQCTLHINATNTIADTATLYLNGSQSTKDDVAKVTMPASESIKWLVVESVFQATGTWGRVGHPTATHTTNLFSGDGVLTVLGGGDLSAPTPDPMTFALAPHGVTKTSISMTATEANDLSLPIAYQFTNETDGVATPWQGARTFVNTGLTEAVSYSYRVRARDALTNITAWSDAASSTPVVDNVMTNDAGGSDSWNVSNNWTLGRSPAGSDSAIIDMNITANIDTAPSNYVGNLELRQGAYLKVLDGDGVNAIPSSPSTLSLGDQSTLMVRTSVTYGPINVLGDAELRTGESTAGHHSTHTLGGVVSGSGALTLVGINNNTFNLNAANAMSGALTMQSGNARVVANADGAFGSGDVHINSGASLEIGASLGDAIDDGAQLFLSGGKGNSATKVVLNSSETVGWFWIDGSAQPTGTWGAVSSGATYETNLFSGAGILNVVGGADVTPPTPDPMTFEVVPHGVDYTSIAMTAADAVDPSTPVEYQFTNETDGVATSWQLARSWVNTGLTEAASYSYRVRARDAFTNVTAWSDAATATPVIDNIMISSIGGTDSWNVSNNWTLGHAPIGSDSAIISNNVSADVTAIPSNYAGNLILRPGASLAIQNPDGSGVIPVGPALLSMGDGSALLLQHSGSLTFSGPVEVQGDVRITHGGNPSHHLTQSFDGVISGSGSLTFLGSNNNIFRLNTANTLGGALYMGSGNSRVEANADSAFGTADVTILNGASLVIAASLSDTIDDGAMLFLEGGIGNQPTKVVLNSDESIVALWVDDVLQSTGTYGRVGHPTAVFTNSLFSGNGTLTVGGPDVRPPLPDPMTLSTLPYRVDATTITMTATEGVDVNGPVEYQFTNVTVGAGSAWQTERPWINTGLVPDSDNSYRLRARDAVGNTGAWSVVYAYVENMMVSSANGPAPNAAWNRNGWNTNVNWSLGSVPAGSDSVVISNGVLAEVYGAPPAFSGALILRAGATLQTLVGSVLPVAPAPLILNNDASIVLRVGSALTFYEIVLPGEGAATIWGGISTSGHHQQRNFNSEIHGEGGLNPGGGEQQHLQFEHGQHVHGRVSNA